MSRSPQDPHNSDDHRDRQPPAESRSQYSQHSEAERLRREEKRLREARRNDIFNRITNGIYLLVGALEILLGIRFFLRLFGANPDNAFALFIYGFSEPFVAPFSTLFISPTAGGGVNIFDVNLLIAMIVYGILGGLAVWLVRYVRG